MGEFGLGVMRRNRDLSVTAPWTREMPIRQPGVVKVWVSRLSAAVQLPYLRLHQALYQLSGGLLGKHGGSAGSSPDDQKSAKRPVTDSRPHLRPTGE
jgi:hypothetical protein